LRLMVAQLDLTLHPSITDNELEQIIHRAQRGMSADMPNAHGCAKLLSDANRRLKVRLYKKRSPRAPSFQELTTLIPDDFMEENSFVGCALDRLNSFVGLAEVKGLLHNMIARIQWNQERKRLAAKEGNGIVEVHAESRHMVFSGAPGTGKTTVARELATIFREMGELRIGHMVETDRSGMVASYVGHTAPLTKRKVQEALGGVLFIDEAYALTKKDGGKNDAFGDEAVTQLLKMMEDHRDDLIVIVAGYGNEMDQLLDSNPGLKDRFVHRLHFADYSVAELQQIGEEMITGQKLQLSDKGRRQFHQLLDDTASVAKRGKNFSNARFVRNLIDRAVGKLAVRVMQMKKDGAQVNLNELDESDFIELVV